MNNSITWDGEDLSAYKLFVEEYDKPLMAKPTFSELLPASGDPYYTSSNTESKKLTLNCVVKGVTEQQLDENMDAILSKMHPLLGDKTLVLDNKPNRRHIGRVTSVSEPSLKGRWAYVFSISLMVFPQSQDLDETNVSASISADPDTMTVSNVSGSAPRQFAEFYVRNETGGALVSQTIVINNNTTSESLTWRGSLSDDAWLRIGTLESDGRYSASIDVSTGTGSDPEAEVYGDAMAGYQSGTFPRLKGGVDNSITVEGISTGTLEVTYRGRYI